MLNFVVIWSVFITNLFNIWNKDYEVKEGYDDEDIDVSGIILPGDTEDDF